MSPDVPGVLPCEVKGGPRPLCACLRTGLWWAFLQEEGRALARGCGGAEAGSVCMHVPFLRTRGVIW